MSTMGSIIGAYLGGEAQTKSAEKAARSQEKMADRSNKLLREMWETGRADLAPFLAIELAGAQIGKENLERLNAMASGGFKASEGYKFRLGEGINAFDKSAVAGGRSRNADMSRFVSGLSSDEYDKYMNLIRSLAGTSTGYVGQSVGAGNAFAQGAGVNNRYAGNAAAQAALTAGQAQANLWNTVGQAPGNAWSTWQYMRPQQQYGSQPQYYGGGYGGGAGGMNTGAPAHVGAGGTTAFGM